MAAERLLRLSPGQVRPVAEMMARAFEDYPLTAYFYPDAATRREKIARGFRSLLRFGVLYGEVYATSSAFEGAAMWLYSRNSRRTLWRNIRSGNISALFPPAFRRNPRQRSYMGYAMAVHQRCAPYPHMYLQLLGVDPDRQGEGYSGRLLRPVFHRLDEEGLPCYLETQAEKNVAIYRHFGFKVVEEGIVPGSQVCSWAMLREVGGK
jgi:GNAT superfamily N-acetyltransferase